MDNSTKVFQPNILIYYPSSFAFYTPSYSVISFVVASTISSHFVQQCFNFSGFGVKSSAVINSFLTGVNLVVIILVVLVGFSFAKFKNWTDVDGGFLPYGVPGVLSGAATCFYAYVGFDSIATSGEEAQDPSKSIPIATVLAMVIVSLGKMQHINVYCMHRY